MDANDIISPDLGKKAAELQAKMALTNPSERPEKSEATRKRIPMTTPQRRLETTTLPGYHLQWIRGTPDRMQQARAAGFEVVRVGEVQTNAAVLGADSLEGVSTDLGDAISIPDGEEVIAGQGVRLHLMKQPQEYYDEDMQIRQKDNDSVRDALAAGLTGAGQSSGETATDIASRFVDRERTKLPELFRKKT